MVCCVVDRLSLEFQVVYLDFSKAAMEVARARAQVSILKHLSMNRSQVSPGINYEQYSKTRARVSILKGSKDLSDQKDRPSKVEDEV